MYRVLLSFFPDFYRVLLSLASVYFNLPVFTGFYRVLLSLAGCS